MFWNYIAKANASAPKIPIHAKSPPRRAGKAPMQPIQRQDFGHTRIRKKRRIHYHLTLLTRQWVHCEPRQEPSQRQLGRRQCSADVRFCRCSPRQSSQPRQWTAEAGQRCPPLILRPQRQRTRRQHKRPAVAGKRLTVAGKRPAVAGPQRHNRPQASFLTRVPRLLMRRSSKSTERKW